MGTRNLTCVVKNGEYKVAQYGQFDGYPEYMGVNILRFLKKFNKGKFISNLEKVSFATEEELLEQWKQCGAKDDGMVSIDVAELHKKKFPENSRDTGEGILNIIQNLKKPIKIRNAISFASDSLFCEWAYVIDLDNNTFEVFKGFNESPLKEGERFYNFPLEESNLKETFYPVKLVVKYSLDNLPVKEIFLLECKDYIG